MCTLAVTNQLLIKQIDVNNAFLNGVLEEEIYMVQPPCFEATATDRSLVYKLNKALYGLKEAPSAWFDRLKSPLVQHGSKANKCGTSCSDSILAV